MQSIKRSVMLLRGEFRSYNSSVLASSSNTVLKGSSKGNYSNIHYVKMTEVELLNFSGDNVIRAPVNVLCNAGVDVKLLALYNCYIKSETEEKPESVFYQYSHTHYFCSCVCSGLIKLVPSFILVT